MIVRNHINRILADVGAAIPPDGKRDYFRLHRDRFAMILAALPTDAGNRALEIGVNPGLFTQALPALTLEQLGWVMRHADIRTYAPGAVIIEQGSPADNLP